MTKIPHRLDLAYNPRLKALHLEESLAHWEAASKATRRAMPCRLDVLYGLGEKETLDVFMPLLPSGQRSKGIMIFIHGGYWRTLDKASNSFVANAICAAGYTAVIPNYALCPINSIEGIVKQLLRACAWTYRNATQLGSRADQITVSGHSAGGHLTAMMMAARFDLMDADLPRDLLKAGLSISGLYDLTPHSKAPFLAKDIGLSTAAMVKRVSPIRYAAPRNKLHTVYGAKETSGFADQDALIKQTWGAQVKSHGALKGHDHFTILSELAEPHSPMARLMQGISRA